MYEQLGTGGAGNDQVAISSADRLVIDGEDKNNLSPSGDGNGVDVVYGDGDHDIYI